MPLLKLTTIKVFETLVFVLHPFAPCFASKPKFAKFLRQSFRSGSDNYVDITLLGMPYFEDWVV